MHELALTQSIVEMVAKHAQGRTVRRVTLEVGKLTCVMPDALRFCFDLVAAGTALDGARLDIREIEGRARCVTCGEEFIRHTLYTDVFVWRSRFCTHLGRGTAYQGVRAGI